MNAILIYSIWTGPRMRSAVDQQQPFTSDQQAIIRSEMERLLRAPEFSGSKRCSDFLTYAVEQTLLGGQEAELKERTVAVEVFGRSPDYDSSDDSIVRVTARDLRKRLAQCYVGAAADHAVRIELAAGSYRARFRWPAIETTRAPSDPEPRLPWLLTASAAAVSALSRAEAA